MSDSLKSPSLLHPRPNSRANTNSEYEYQDIHNPLDEQPKLPYELSLPSHQFHKGSHDPGLRSPASTPNDSDRANPLSNTQDQSPSEHLFPLLPRHSTKAMVSRFESISRGSSDTAQQVPSLVSSPRRSTLLPESPHNRTFKKEKNRNPLRDSFKNLLTVFGRKGKSKEERPILSTRYQSTISTSSPHNPLSLSQATVADLTPSRAALRTGAVLYLCKSLSADTLPVWNSCTASLFRTHLLVEYQTSYGNPVMHTIPFTPCTDVHSIAASNIESRVKMLLPNPNKAHIFEISFDGKLPEKFAASSVLERSAWVSSIWDALLQRPEEIDDKSLSPPLRLHTTAIPKPHSTGKTNISDYDEDTRRENMPVRIHCNLETCNDTVDPSSSPGSPSVKALESSGKADSVQTSLRHKDRPSWSPLSNYGRERAQHLALTPNVQVPDHLGALVEDKESVYDFYGDKTPAVPLASPNVTIACNDSLMTHRNDPTCHPEPAGQLQINSTPAEACASIRAENHDDIHPITSQDKSAELMDQIICMRQDLRDMGDCTRSAIAEQLPLSLTAAPEKLSAISERAPIPIDLSSLNARLDELFLQMSSDMLSSSKHSEIILQNINETRLDLKADVAATMSRLETMQLGNSGSQEATMNSNDLSKIHMKLEGLLQRLQDAFVNSQIGSISSSQPHVMELRNLPNSGRSVVTTSGDDCGTPILTKVQANGEDIKEIMASIKEDHERRESQATQQAENVRYLHELNSWLESFVKNTSAQIQTIALGVQDLCREVFDGPGPPGHLNGNANQVGLVSELRSTLAQNKSWEEASATLHSSVRDLLKELTTSGAQGGRSGTRDFATDTVVGMIDRQRQDQEQMLRSIAAELSNDIRGERLRFVEAMKEATAINVQIHVEEFKKELSKEVMGMTQEVGRLQKERQTLEQRIADLFSFIARQQAAFEPRGLTLVDHQRTPYLEPSQPTQQQQPTSRTNRPLPTPTMRYGNEQLRRV